MSSARNGRVTPACGCSCDGKNRQLFHVYVVELASGSLYVGSTAEDVATRLMKSRLGAGARSGRRRSGKYRRDLSPKAVCATRARAEALEAKTARRLRARGWEVEQG